MLYYHGELSLVALFRVLAEIFISKVDTHYILYRNTKTPKFDFEIIEITSVLRAERLNYNQKKSIGNNHQFNPVTTSVAGHQQSLSIIPRGCFFTTSFSVILIRLVTTIFQDVSEV